MTDICYYQTYLFMEQSPLQRPFYANIAYPFDLHTWFMLLTTFALVTLVSWFAMSREKSKPSALAISFLMTFGVLFQEYRYKKYLNKSLFLRFIHMLWVIAVFFLTMGFMANLKSSLTRKNFEEATMTMAEMVDKDMTIHSDRLFTNFLELKSDRITGLDKRLLCQIRKKKSTYIPQ